MVKLKNIIRGQKARVLFITQTFNLFTLSYYYFFGIFNIIINKYLYAKHIYTKKYKRPEIKYARKQQ